MKTVKIGIIGIGNIGQLHLNNISKIKKAEITALCDSTRAKVKKVSVKYGGQVFTDYKKLLKARICDSILICTPHYAHTTIGIDALKAGYHVLIEKPISVHKADCERLIAAHKNKKQIFAAMFNQRTDPHYRKVKKLIDDGKLGPLQRVSWIITDWFRPNIYYRSSSWRATWAGEGGGVLLNQCPHQLDLLQWLCGMPVRMRAFCGIGKRHKIEAEDEVTAYFEYANGATGVFVTTTGEAPGTNRLEICGDKGKVIVENGKISFTRNKIATSKFTKTTKDSFSKPGIKHITIPADGFGGQHAEIIENFTDAIMKGKKLIAPAEEGINSVELANAMLYSSLMEKTVELPLDGKAFERKLNQLMKNSKKKRR
jgi:predicted dehydrogenase